MEEAGFFERRVGTTLRGKWTLERLLGVGGMAAVYEAVHTKLGRREAVKILHPEIAHSLDARTRFEQEAQAVNRLQHPGAVEVRDIDISEEGAPFLVMELLEGEALAEALKRLGPLPPHDAFRMAEQVLDVLAAAHEVGIVHRDIKPDNIFLLRDGRVKVLDFGVARLRQREGHKAPTRTGALIGTVAYMAPEQVSGRSDLDGRADVFAVGATLFRALTGFHVHETDNDLQLIMLMASQPAPRLRELAPAIPEAFALVVDRALAFERAHRYASARAMQEDIRRVLQGGSPVHALAPLPPASSVAASATPTVIPTGDVRPSAVVTVPAPAGSAPSIALPPVPPPPAITPGASSLTTGHPSSPAFETTSPSSPAFAPSASLSPAYAPSAPSAAPAATSPSAPTYASPSAPAFPPTSPSAPAFSSSSPSSPVFSSSSPSSPAFPPSALAPGAPAAQAPPGRVEPTLSSAPSYAGFAGTPPGYGVAVRPVAPALERLSREGPSIVVLPGETPPGAPSSPIHRLGRTTVALPLPVLLGLAGGVFVLVVVTISFAVWRLGSPKDQSNDPGITNGSDSSSQGGSSKKKK